MSIAVLFAIALIVRVIIAFSFNIHELAPDATGYHTYAVNLQKFNIHSNRAESPLTENFFREPGNNYFISYAYQIADWMGASVSYISKQEYVNGSIETQHSEFYFARLLYALLESIALIFFYKTLRYKLSSSTSFWISLVFALFVPYAFFVTTLLRDPLLSSLLLILNYYLVSYLEQGKRSSIIVSAIITGVLILVFQVMVLLLLFVPVFVVVIQCFTLKSILNSVLYSSVALMLILPWMYKVYNYYPDARIVKSVGTSFTMELNNCVKSSRELAFFGGITPEKANNFNRSLWQLSSAEQFEKSFNGEFYRMSQDMQNRLNKQPSFTPMNYFKYKAGIYYASLKSLFCPYDFLLTQQINKSEGALSLIFRMLYYLMILLGVIGFFMFLMHIKRFLKMSFIFLFFCFILMIMPGMGNEGRRLLPVFPYLLLGISLFVNGVFEKYINKEGK